VNMFMCSQRSTFPRHATCSAITDGRSRYIRASLRYLVPTFVELFALLLNHCYIDGIYHNVHASYASDSLIMPVTVNSGLSRSPSPRASRGEDDKNQLTISQAQAHGQTFMSTPSSAYVLHSLCYTPHVLSITALPLLRLPTFAAHSCKDYRSLVQTILGHLFVYLFCSYHYCTSITTACTLSSILVSDT